jgi:Flp pilus assembly protein TadD
VIRIYLARLLLAEGRVEEAVAHSRRLLEVPGYGLPGHFNLAYALERQGRSAEARRHYRQALALARRAGNPELVRDIEGRLAD